MDFVRDDFSTIHRRKKLAAWLSTLRGPAKAKPDYSALANASFQQSMQAQALNQAACQFAQMSAWSHSARQTIFEPWWPR